MKKKGATRNKKGYYPIDGENYVSVTTFLKVIAKEFLMKWYGNMERKGIMELFSRAKEKEWNSKKLLKRIKEHAQRKDGLAAERYSGKRSDVGNAVHEAIQIYLTKDKKTKLKSKAARRAFKIFLHWWKKGEYKVLKVEQVISDKQKMVAGTMDIYLERVKDGAKGIGDFKTGKSIYKENHLQLQVYRYLARDEFPNTFAILIHVPQDGGKVKVHPVNDKKYSLETAWYALDLYRGLYE